MKLTTTQGIQIQINPLHISKIKWAWGGARIFCNGFMGNRVIDVKESASRVRRINEEAIRKIAPSTFDLVKREFCNF